MALTPFQRDVCRLLADRRIASGESYVAGGAALNERLSTSRLSRDLDLFHDTEEALAATWASFEGEAPDGAALAARWRSQLEEAREVIERLPPEESGRCVLGPAAVLYEGSPAALRDDLAAARHVFHPGRIRGAFPTIRRG